MSNNVAEKKEEEPINVRPAEKDKSQNKQNFQWVKANILFLIVNFFITISIIYWYDHRYATKVAVVNVGAYMEVLKNDFATGKLNDNDLQKKFDEIEMTINRVPENYVVLIGNVVMRGQHKIIELGGE